ncbi:MAG: hypothetical protein RR528_05715 [Angelakisella sp.]
MIEMVTKISQAEEAASLMKKEAQTKAVQMEAEAHKIGKAELARLRTHSEASQLASEMLDNAKNESHELSKFASARISKAASLIVERIVDTK